MGLYTLSLFLQKLSLDPTSSTTSFLLSMASYREVVKYMAVKI